MHTVELVLLYMYTVHGNHEFLASTVHMYMYACDIHMYM